MSIDSPNYGSLDRFSFAPRRVDKPWGWELIWAVTDAYVGKVLFVRAGESLSLQFHREKDESWYIESGRAKLELGDAGQEALDEEIVTTGGVLPLPAGHRPPRDRDRGHDNPRGLDAALEDVVRLEDRTAAKARLQPERVLAWDGCVNVREWEGCRSKAAARRRSRRRSRDSIRSLTDAGWQALVDYGVRTAVDLRSDRRRRRRPSGDVPIEIVRIPLQQRRADRRGVAVDARGVRGAARPLRQEFASAVTVIARAGEPVVVHCLVGRDRTGLCAGSCCGSAGVDLETISADHALSDDYLSRGGSRGTTTRPTRRRAGGACG